MSILIPILITESIFPQYKNKPYLKNKGLSINFILFLLGILLVNSLINRIITQETTVQFYSFVLILISTALSVIIALKLKKNMVEKNHSKVLSPIYLYILSFITSALYLGSLLFSSQLLPLLSKFPFVILQVFLVLFILIIFSKKINKMSKSKDWSPKHTFAVISGILISNPILTLLKPGTSVTEFLFLSIISLIIIIMSIIHISKKKDSKKNI